MNRDQHTPPTGHSPSSETRKSTVQAPAPVGQLPGPSPVENTAPVENTSSAEEWTIRDWQQQVDRWIHSVGVRYFSELTNLAQLMEEVGELARLISRTYGDQSFKAGESERNLADEMADVLFVLTCLANQTGVDLQQALAANLAKKNRRDSSRHLQNSKLHEKPSD